jgi:RNA polymerase primary sigma factor
MSVQIYVEGGEGMTTDHFPVLDKTEADDMPDNEAVGQLEADEVTMACDGVVHALPQIEAREESVNSDIAERLAARRARRRQRMHEGQYRGGSDATGIHLNRLGTIPLLTAQEERELAQTIEAGRKAQKKTDKARKQGQPPTETDLEAIEDAKVARDRFINANLRLVVSIAKRYPLPNTMELIDLIQEGTLGLERAVEKFDWRKGFKFSTYATWWIRQACGRALDQKASLIRLPGDRAGTLRRKFKDAIDEENLDDETARLYRLSTPLSLNDYMDKTDRTTERGDLMASPVPTPEQILMEAADDEEIHERYLDVEQTAEGLDSGEWRAVKARYIEGGDKELSYAEIARRLDLKDPEAGRRFTVSAADKLRVAYGEPTQKERNKAEKKEQATQIVSILARTFNFS